MVMVLSQTTLPEGFRAVVGDDIRVADAAGKPQWGTITTVDEEGVTVDLNHPLAGEDLTFRIRVMSILGARRRR